MGDCLDQVLVGDVPLPPSSAGKHLLCLRPVYLACSQRFPVLWSSATVRNELFRLGMRSTLSPDEVVLAANEIARRNLAEAALQLVRNAARPV